MKISSPPTLPQTVAPFPYAVSVATPYLGTVYRAASSAGSPTDTVLLATLPVMLEWRNWRAGRVGSWLLAVAVPLLLLTLSKDVAITFLGC